MDQILAEKLRNVSGSVNKTESFGAVDGPGIRYVFFLQCCALRCLYCHNPETIPRAGGTVWTAGQAAAEALRYKAFIRNGGVTFSGGEPLLQPEFVYAATMLLKDEGIGSAIDTSGSQNPDDPAVRRAIDAADLILLDLKASDDGIATALTGRGIATALATLGYCESSHKPVWIRHVLLSGYTLDDGQLNGIADILAGFGCVQRVELLPFHKLGEPKWEQSRLKYRLLDTPATTAEQLRHAAAILLERGLPVRQ